MHVLACLTVLILSTSAWAADNGSLSASTSLSNEGYFVLDWETSSPESSITLEQSTSEQFSNPLTREIAGAGAATITGLEDGTYYFRLVDSGSVISDTVSVSVIHHSLSRAGGFFLLGLCLFSTLVFTIVHGNRQAGL